MSYRYGNISIPYVPLTEPLRIECSHFVRCVLDGRLPKSSGVVGLNVVRILESAQKSISNGGMDEKIDWRQTKTLVGGIV